MEYLYIILFFFFLIFAVGINIIYNCHGNNYDVAKETQKVRQLCKEYKAKEGRKQYLRIVVDAYFSGRSVIIGRSYTELASCSTGTGKAEH